MNVKEVQIIRRPPASHLPEPIVNDSTNKIGSHFVGQIPLIGLDKEEEEKYLPSILGVGPEDRDWNKKRLEFWAEMIIKVRTEGVVLDITTDDKGNPRNVEDYIRYQWCRRHKFVAKDQAELDRDPTKRFYILDPEKANEVKHKAASTRMAAYKQLVLLESKGETDKLARVYRLMTKMDPSKTTPDYIITQLELIVRERPIEFIGIVNDKDIDIRAEIAEMVENDVLTLAGNSVLADSDVIGNTMQEAIAYFKNKSNSQTVTMLRAKLEQARG